MVWIITVPVFDCVMRGNGYLWLVFNYVHLIVVGREKPTEQVLCVNDCGWCSFNDIEVITFAQ